MKTAVTNRWRDSVHRWAVDTWDPPMVAPAVSGSLLLLVISMTGLQFIGRNHRLGPSLSAHQRNRNSSRQFHLSPQPQHQELAWRRRRRRRRRYPKMGRSRSKNKQNRMRRRDSRPPVPEEGAEREGSWVPKTKPDEIISDVRTRAIQAYEKVMANVKEFNDRHVQKISQQTIEEMPRFRLSTYPTREEIVKFLAEKKARSLKIAPIIVPVDVHGDLVQVPVTPAKPADPEDYTHHLIVLPDPTNGDEVHVLVEEFSGYIKAIRVVLEKEVESKKPWHLLGSDGLPTRFEKTSQTTYADDYEELGCVCFHEETIHDIFRFFFSFNKKPLQKATGEGQIVLDTSFVALGELPRFEAVQQMLFEGLTRPRNDPRKLTIGFAVLIRDWAALSKAIYQLYIAILEAKMVRLGMSGPLASKGMDNAIVLWKERQRFHSLIRFYFEDSPLSLGLLCGGQLHLLRHDPDKCDQVTMRKVFRFKGHWLQQIQEAYDSGELAPGTH